MADSADASLEDADAIISDLAYWVGSCDAGAALRMTEGFGAALFTSAAMRASGSNAQAIALALAEKAEWFRRQKDSQHAGWLLLSLKLELLHLAASGEACPTAQGASEMFSEVEQIMRQLVRRGTAALAGVR